MGIREIDDRYPEFAAPKEKRRKKHSYGKLKGKNALATKIVALSLASAVAIDVGGTAISNEVNGTDDPGFFQTVITQMAEETKLEPEITSFTASYSKKKVAVSFDVSLNDTESVNDVILTLDGLTYSVTLDEVGHGEATLDLLSDPGTYDIGLTVDYLLKKNKKLESSISIEKPVATPPEVSYEATYDGYKMVYKGNVVENDAEISRVYVTMKDKEYDLTLVDGEYIYEEDIYLDNGTYKTVMQVEYELDGDTGCIFYESNFEVNFKDPDLTFKATYSATDSILALNGKVTKNDATIKKIEFSCVMYELGSIYKEDGSFTVGEVWSQKYTWGIEYNSNGTFEDGYEIPLDSCRDLKITVYYTLRGKSKSFSRTVRPMY